jgi:hypothetical protein
VSSWASRGSTRHFGVTETTSVLPAALPETDPGAGSVVVGRRRAEALLLLVVTTESELYESRDQEEKTRQVSTSNDEGSMR